MMEQARKHLEAAEWPEAETLLRAELDGNPDNAEAALMLAQVRQQLGDLDDALRFAAGRLQIERLAVRHGRSAASASGRWAMA